MKFTYPTPPLLETPELVREQNRPLAVRLRWSPQAQTSGGEHCLIYRRTWLEEFPALIGEAAGDAGMFIDDAPLEGAVNTYSVRRTIIVGKAKVLGNLSHPVSVFAFDSGFHDYDSLRLSLRDLAQTYPEQVAFRDIGGSRSGTHKVMAVVVDDTRSQTKWKKTFWLSAQLHASETIGTDLIMGVLRRLLTSRSTDCRWQE